MDSDVCQGIGTQNGGVIFFSLFADKLSTFLLHRSSTVVCYLILISSISPCLLCLGKMPVDRILPLHICDGVVLLISLVILQCCALYDCAVLYCYFSCFRCVVMLWYVAVLYCMVMCIIV